MARRLAALLFLTTLSGCNAILGLGDPIVASDGGVDATRADGATSDAPSSSDGGSREGASADTGVSTDSSVGTDSGGGCPVDCLGGACKGGVCQPVVLAMAVYPWSLAIDASNVYWTEQRQGGAVSRVPLAGGAVVILSQASGTVTPYDLTVDGSNVYFTADDGYVRSVPIGTGVTQPLFYEGAIVPLGGIAVDSAYLYWANDATPGALRRAPLAGGATLTLLSGLMNPGEIALQGSVLYYVDQGDGILGRVATDGTSPIQLNFVGAGGYGIAVGANRVYWTELDQQSLPSPGEVWSIPSSGGTAMQLAQPMSPAGVEVDPSYVYVATGTGSGAIVRVPIGGFDAGPGFETIAAGQMTPRSIAVDAVAVYWTDPQAGTVMKVAKPP